jgi:acyl carrier protein
MVPQAFEWLDALPRLANGKIDRAALPAPRFERETGASFVPAGNELEAKLLGIWREVLQLETLGVHDDFFALGGHSLLATRVIARIRDQLQIEVPLINLFEYPTIARFGASIAALHAHQAAAGPDDALISVTR